MGGRPLSGDFQLTINGKVAGAIPHSIDSRALEQTINDLQAVGEVSVQSGYQTEFLIPDITASVLTDGTVASLSGVFRQHIAPGTLFRVGGSDEVFDRAVLVGSAVMTPSSPIDPHQSCQV